VSDIARSDVFRGNFGKNFHGCPMKVSVKFMPPLVNKPRTVSDIGSGSHNVYEDGWEIEMLRIIGEALNMSYFADYADFLLVKADEAGINTEKLEGNPFISGGETVGLGSFIDNFGEYTRGYFSPRTSWYMPCSVKYERWSHFCNIFSVDMWICFTLSPVLAVITVSCILNYRHKLHLHESKSYSHTGLECRGVHTCVVSS
jgi:hypothetical protein